MATWVYDWNDGLVNLDHYKRIETEIARNETGHIVREFHFAVDAEDNRVQLLCDVSHLAAMSHLLPAGPRSLS